jgi:hypothetical protein
MATIDQRIGTWDDAAWCLAATALAGRSAGETGALVEAARQVLAAAGVMDLRDGQTGTAQQVGYQAAAPLHITSSLLRGEEVNWAANGADALRAQGEASAQAAPMFAAFMAPQMGDLPQRLSRDGAVMLDVGTGIAALAVGFAEHYPQLRVVGLDVADAALALAEKTIASSSAGARVTVRKQDVAELTESDAYDLVWLPAPFIPPTSLEVGLTRIAAALRSGGWLIVGHGKYGDDPLADALNRFKTIAFGGTPLATSEAERLLSANGLIDVRTFPTPPGAPAITVARRSGEPLTSMDTS